MAEKNPDWNIVRDYRCNVNDKSLSECICQICHLILCRPYFCIPCGHKFCKECCSHKCKTTECALSDCEELDKAEYKYDETTAQNILIKLVLCNICGQKHTWKELKKCCVQTVQVDIPSAFPVNNNNNNNDNYSIVFSENSIETEIESVETLKRKVTELEKRVKELECPCFIWTISNFKDEKVKDGYHDFSPKYKIGNMGPYIKLRYEIEKRVNDNLFSLGFCLVPSNTDPILPWPFICKFIVTILAPTSHSLQLYNQQLHIDRPKPYQPHFTLNSIRIDQLHLINDSLFVKVMCVT